MKIGKAEVLTKNETIQLIKEMNLNPIREEVNFMRKEIRRLRDELNARDFKYKDGKNKT